MAGRDEAAGLGTDQQIVPLGATVAVYMTPVARQTGWVVKWASGGTLEMIGSTAYGATLTAALLATASGKHYVVGTSEVLSISGTASFYLAATSATVVANVIRSFS